MKLQISKDKTKLFKKAEPWPFDDPPYDIIELSEAMIDFIKEVDGIGIAYNQLDLKGSYQVFAMLGEPESFICINPKIVQPSEEMIELDEACLSFPCLTMKVNRPRHLRVRFTAPDGQVYTKTFANMTARCFQHEYNHVMGIPFWNGVSKLRFDMAIRKAKKRGYDYSYLNYTGKSI